MNQRFTHTVILSLLLLLGLGACASGLKTESGLATKGSVTLIDSSLEETGEDQNLPKLEFDKKLLQQVLISNFASYEADWPLGAKNALLAAQRSQDYRLARLAALLALRAKDYNLATQAAELWSNLTDQADDAQTTLLLAYLGNDDAEAAYNGFSQRQVGKPIDEYIKDVAGLLLRQTNVDVAIAVAQRYLKENPESPQVALSVAYIAEGFESKVLLDSALKRALALRPEWDAAAQMKLNLLRRAGKKEEAATYIREYVTRYPSSVGMRINYATELAREQKYSQALVLMQAVLKDDQINVPALTYAAALAQQLEQSDLAKKYYRRVLKIDPKNDEVRWSLASFAVQDEQYSTAEDYYQDIDSEQNYFQAQLQVAYMRYHTKGIKSAINYLRSLEPKTETEYVDRATTQHYLLMDDRQYEEAFGNINEALVYLPNNVDLLYSRALVAAELNELKIAENDLRNIIKVHPDHANALNALGYTLADQTDRYQEAKKLIESALDLRPNDVHILDSMGWVLYRLNKYDEAIKYLQKAYETTAEVEVAAHLGEVLWESGDVKRARQIWQEALDKDAENPLLIKTLARYGLQQGNLATDTVSFAKP